MSRGLRRLSARWVRRHPLQVGLSALGIALGVAVAVSVDLAIGSAQRAFELSTEAVAGRATHHATTPGGRVPDTAVAALLRVPGVTAAAPVVTGGVLAPRGDRALRVLGIDAFLERPFRPALGFGDPGAPSAVALLEPGTAVLPAALAASLGSAAGDMLAVEVAGVPRSLRVVGLLDPADALSRRALADVVIVDVGTAQAIFGVAGLDRVELILADGADLDAVARALGVVIVPAGSGARALGELTRAFEINLRALSLLALVFGAFLIYNSMTFSVVQRRELIGTLRVLGATRGQVTRMVLAEALLLGLVGAAVGLGLGVLLGRGLVELVSRTINDLYFTLEVTEIDVPFTALVRGAAFGIVATLVAAVPATLEAAYTAPRAAQLRSGIEDRFRALVPRLALAGLLLAGAGGVALPLTRTSLTLSFAALFAVIFGATMLIPWAARHAALLGRRPLGAAFGVLGRMAAGGVAAGLSRTAPAIAALSVAVSVSIGVGVMIHSFRAAVGDWLGTTLIADIYVSPPLEGASGPAGTLDPAVLARIEAIGSVADARPYRYAEVQLRFGDETETVRVVAPRHDARLGRSLVEVGTLEPDAWARFASGRAVFATEPLAIRSGVRAGDTIALRTPAGWRSFPVVGVYRDYSSERGGVLLERAAYASAFRDSATTSLAVFLRDGADPDAVADSIAAEAAPLQRLFVASNEGLRRASFETFDRTFAITAVLRTLTLIVAFVGVLAALMALQLERARELGVLRANGLTPGQLWRLVASQTGVIGLISGLLALPLGALLAALMVFVINRRSFGWSMELLLPPSIFLQGVLAALVAALIAGLYPSFRMAATSPAEALRGE